MLIYQISNIKYRKRSKCEDDDFYCDHDDSLEENAGTDINTSEQSKHKKGDKKRFKFKWPKFFKKGKGGKKENLEGSMVNY